MKNPITPRTALFALCSLLSTATQAAEKLHVYIWADYIKPELIERFQDEQDCEVVIDTFDSNESMFAKVRAGAAGYDILVPSNYMLGLLVQKNLLRELDPKLLPNAAQVDPQVLAKLEDKTMRHGVPYAIGYGVLAYRKDRLTSPPDSWAALEMPGVNRKACLLNDMRETLGAALKSLGHSVNTRDATQLTAAAAVVKRWKQSVARFDNEQYKSAIDSGEFVLVHGYSGDLFQVVAENDHVGVLLPREGLVMACDEMVIPATAPQPALAHAFINFLLDPAVAAENMEWTGYVCPNVGGMKKVSPEFLANPAVAVPEAVRAKSEVIEDVGEALSLYTKVWDEVKAGN
ncbi:MAG: spermidine/putrescine ABC transporter substrate-binding protein [Verrucomicrobiaceae bacterium]|nr:spermidine/putrescine ABC transporter substrate-binding protein [Verrucomicrobiaceae bacterium]